MFENLPPTLLGTTIRPHCDAKEPLCDATTPLLESLPTLDSVFSPLKTIVSSPGIRIGIRAHDFGCHPADGLAQRVASAGFDCVQLALGKAIQGVDPAVNGINAAEASAIASAFARHGVGIEVLACYINPLHPDPQTRRTLLDLFKRHLRLAKSFGCSIVALESGSLHGDYSHHPENHSEQAFQQLLPVMRELVDEAGRCGVRVGIEAVASHVVSSPEKMRRLLDEVRSPDLTVVFDPVNLLDLSNASRHHEVLRRALELFGKDIAVVHAKDFRVDGGRFETCPAGTGKLDYQMFLPELAGRSPGIAVLLEEAGPVSSAFSRDFIFKSLSRTVS
jgi:L-ribulose-5-phosphate 3-epimerase